MGVGDGYFLEGVVLPVEVGEIQFGELLGEDGSDGGDGGWRAIGLEGPHIDLDGVQLGVGGGVALDLLEGVGCIGGQMDALDVLEQLDGGRGERVDSVDLGLLVGLALVELLLEEGLHVADCVHAI